ncbi:glucosidase II beta subunit-like-domain-containing protein [Chytriomyces sp. MP71]|nr:glucosidase II beta subunit-like-domain-containing protein [Chytriomyces sp. MP71]
MLRGIDPSQKQKYTRGSESFECLDGSNTIPALAVNDDFCDCKDGSDEPGTSACANGSYFCVGKNGLEFVRIPSSRVNDGVCDPECCDGTDEYNGFIKCLVTCGSSSLIAPILFESLAISDAGSPNAASTAEMDDRQMQLKTSYMPIMLMIIIGYCIHVWLGSRRRKIAQGKHSLPMHLEARHRLRQLVSKRNYDE